MFKALQKLFADDSSPLVRWLRRKCPDISVPDIKAFLPRVHLKVEATQEDKDKKGPRNGNGNGPSGSNYIVINGQRFNCKYSWEIVFYTAKWLISQGKITADKCPIAVTRGDRYLINTEPKHPRNENFRSSKQLSNDLWIEAHGSHSNHVDYARRLLRWAGYSEDILQVHWED